MLFKKWKEDAKKKLGKLNAGELLMLKIRADRTGQVDCSAVCGELLSERKAEVRSGRGIGFMDMDEDFAGG